MEQDETMSEANEKWTFVMESDPAALAQANRRIQTIFFVVFAFFVTAGCWLWWIDPPGGARPSLLLLLALWIAGILLSLFCFRLRGLVKERQAWIGADFLAASSPAVPRGMTIIRYEDILTVNVGLTRGGIVEVGIRAKKLTGLCIRQVYYPAAVVRAIFEWGPTCVKWRRLRWPYTRLTRDEVRILIEDAHLPPIDAMLHSAERIRSV